MESMFWSPRQRDDVEDDTDTNLPRRALPETELRQVSHRKHQLGEDLDAARRQSKIPLGGPGGRVSCEGVIGW